MRVIFSHLGMMGAVVMMAAREAAKLDSPLDMIEARSPLPSPSTFGRITTHFDPRISRHTGRPHEHARERARRARQAAPQA